MLSVSDITQSSYSQQEERARGRGYWNRWHRHKIMRMAEAIDPSEDRSVLLHKSLRKLERLAEKFPDLGDVELLRQWQQEGEV